MVREGIIMTYCPKCGTKNEDDAVYCNKCGAPLDITKKGYEKTCFFLKLLFLYKQKSI